MQLRGHLQTFTDLGSVLCSECLGGRRVLSGNISVCLRGKRKGMSQSLDRIPACLQAEGLKSPIQHVPSISGGQDRPAR
jgi:hypothetical protein